MGVSGLLPVLKPILTTKSLAAYRGQSLAIDGYAWLHRAVYSCTWELAHEQPTGKYLVFFQRRVSLLRERFGIEPYFVFDGDDFASKAETEEQRQAARRTARDAGMRHLEQGDRKRAHGCFSRAVDVSPQLAKTIIEYLKAVGVRYVVAPYEADSQMVYLEQQGLVAGIISEDSDLLVFGCQRLLTKFNDRASTVVEVCAADFKRVREVPVGQMTRHQLRMVACVSGCDYTSGVPRIGIKKAFQIVKRFDSMDKVIQKLKLDKYQVPSDFEDQYRRADLSFVYPRVYDPVNNTMTTLTPIPDNIDSHTRELMLQSIGQLTHLDIHRGIARGDLCPHTKKQLISREELLTLKKKDTVRSIQRSFSTPVVSKRPGFKTIDMFEGFSKCKPNKVVIGGNKLVKSGNFEIGNKLVKSGGKFTIDNKLVKSGGKITIDNNLLKSGGNNSIKSDDNLKIDNYSIKSGIKLTMGNNLLKSGNNLLKSGGNNSIKSDDNLKIDNYSIKNDDKLTIDNYSIKSDDNSIKSDDEQTIDNYPLKSNDKQTIDNYPLKSNDKLTIDNSINNNPMTNRNNLTKNNNNLDKMYFKSNQQSTSIARKLCIFKTNNVGPLGISKYFHNNTTLSQSLVEDDYLSESDEESTPDINSASKSRISLLAKSFSRQPLSETLLNDSRSRKRLSDNSTNTTGAKVRKVSENESAIKPSKDKRISLRNFAYND